MKQTFPRFPFFIDALERGGTQAAWLSLIPFLLFLLAIHTTAPLAAQDADPLPGAVWNHAYRENGEADSLDAVLAGARDAYVLLDLFDDPEARSAIEALRARSNVIGAYVSVGTGEEWREDFPALEPYLVDRPWGEWAGEYFVDRIEPGLVTVMESRLEQVAAWGADFVEFDNMDWALDDVMRRRYGFTVSVEDAAAYVEHLRVYAASLGLCVMAKNLTEGCGSFDGVTFESWRKERDWWDTRGLEAFLDDGKLCVVFHYGERRAAGALEYFRNSYGPALLVLVESREAGGYEHRID